MVLFLALLLMCCLAEYLLNRMMLAMDVLDKKYMAYHAACAVLRNAWVFFSSWFTIPLPVYLVGLFLLLFLNVVPYPGRKLLMNNFMMMIFLIYAALLLTVIGSAGLMGLNVAYMMQDVILRGIILTATFVIFNTLCSLLLHFHPELLWRVDYDKTKVAIYTHFLFVCALYHILDATILHLYPTSRINYLLLMSGDILILFLLFNFLNYNQMFAKSQEVRREYEENEVLIAQQYFEKASLEKMSEMDSLTNAYNRREICSIMARRIQDGKRLACVFIDLDGLKRANDRYGHTFGDLMLKRFTDTCMKAMEGRGLLARIGGDEFLLVFEEHEIEDMDAWIKKLQLTLLEPEDDKEKISFSYGISYGEESVDNYIITADQRMYADKNRKQREKL